MEPGSKEFIYVNAYCARVKELRERRGWTAEQMATALGIPADRYRKYETRSPLPAYLGGAVCSHYQCWREFRHHGPAQFRLRSDQGPCIKAPRL